MADLRIAAENSDAGIKKRRALQDLSWPLRELAANLIRIVRGAGKSHELLDQMTRVMKAMQEYCEAVGAWPSAY
jgi:hypothetical protein